MIGTTNASGAGGASSGAIEAAPKLAEQLEALECALKALHGSARAVSLAPRSVFDLRPAASACERAIVGLLDGYDGRRDVIVALTEAAAAADELAAELERAVATDPGLEPAVEWARAAAGWLRKAVASPSSGRIPLPAPLVASIELPSLHRPARQTLRPFLVVAPPITPPPAAPAAIDPSLPPADRMAIVRARAGERQAAAAERRAAREAKLASRRAPVDPDEPPLGFVAGKHRALTVDEAIAERARRCFEDVAALGMMRAPQLGEDWRAAGIIDKRMLAAVDAIVGLGPVALAGLERFVVDAPAKDPTRGFAVALIGGSLEGRDGLAVLERSMAFLGMAEATHTRAVADGLALAPNPDVPVLLRRWLADEDPAFRALGLAVLARRGEATVDEIARALADDAAEVIEAALIPAAIARVAELPGRAEELLVGHTAAELLSSLAWALVLGDVPFAVQRLSEWLGTPREELALLPIVLAGGADEVAKVVVAAEARATAARVQALGFAGAVGSLPLLLRVLRAAKDDELKLAVAFALQRLTDAPLFDDTVIAPEKVDVPEPDEPDDPAPTGTTARRVSDPRDLPGDGSPDRAVLPSVDADRWQAWLGEREAYPEQLRLRRGRAYTPAVSLLELADYAVTPFERTVLHRELVIRTGDGLPFDARAFVMVQQAQLDAWAEPAKRGSSQPGSWVRARRRA